MKTDEIREKFLEFFATKNHTICPSDVLVPKWDKSVLFTPAGMNQFKDHFLGKVELEFTRAATCQKCLRTGDIENVGRTAYHHTFFEMLGNFSFGDYFKREAIEWAWEFLTDPKWLGIDPERLSVSVYLDDDEAEEIWHSVIGLPKERIQRLGEDDNFWPAGAPSQGPDGVCGPCSEIFYHPDEGPECEIWNLVFTQFNRQGDPPDNLHPLPRKNIDTGMGLERIAAVMQGVTTNFHIDTLLPIVMAAAEVVGQKYEPESENGRRLRRITDHIRACTMAIHENVYPGSNKEEYVIRRLLRRAVLQGHEMGMREPFLYRLVPEVVNQMKRAYPELIETGERVAQVVRVEEENFLASLDEGLERINRVFEEMKRDGAQVVPGGVAAELYQTFGIPAELFESMARDRGFEFDWAGYQSAMEEHGRVSGKIADTVMGDFGPVDELKKRVKSTEFTGYELTEGEANVVGLVAGDATVEALTADSDSPQIVVLDRTPFYAEAGGQVGDTGVLVGPNGKFRVTDTQRSGNVTLHYGEMLEGELRVDDKLWAEVDRERRDAIRRAHSATHILHHALQTTLGSHAQQRGSKVADDWLRFDFSNLSAVGEEALQQIERLANERVREAAPIRADILPLEEARKQGAMMLFGEKYPDPVRMVSMGSFSKELCGGTHLESTGQVEAFEIIAEESVSSGTRRIEAITGKRAVELQQRVRRDVRELCSLLGTTPEKLPDAVAGLANQIKSLKKQIDSGKRSKAKEQVAESASGDGQAVESMDYVAVRGLLKQVARQLNVPLLEARERVEQMFAEKSKLEKQLDEMASSEQIDAETLYNSGEVVSGIRLIVQSVGNSNPNLMRQLIDQLRKRDEPMAIFLASTVGMDKVVLVAGLSRKLVEQGLSAGEWVKAIAPIVGGGGGGKPDLAQAGGKQPERLTEALEAARDWIRSKVVS